jgi:hypothetical protein
MTSWLNRHYFLGCILASVALFVAAGIHLLGGSASGAMQWGSLGLFFMFLAIFSRFGSRHPF